MVETVVRYIDFHDVIECLIAAIEARDKYISGHSSRVAGISMLIAQEMGIQDPQLEIIHMAAHMHDIGKIGISDKILSKPEKLNQEEWAMVKEHPRIGYNILSQSIALKKIAVIVLHHHERWDGKGYPDGLKNVEIPIGSRIIAMADSIDAMINERPYKKQLSAQECVSQLKINSGLQFDPSITNTTLKVCFPKGRFCYNLSSVTA